MPVIASKSFTQDALVEISSLSADENVAAIRRRGFAGFEGLPMPSPATEEWRYTDLQDLDLDAYTPYAPEPRAANLDEVDAGALRAAGSMGDRAGLAIQHNSTIVTAHLDPAAAADGVLFGPLDQAASARPELLADRLHGAVPVDRSRFTALHAAFRSGGAFVFVPKDVRVALPLQVLTYVDRDRMAVFPHTVIVLEEGAELSFIDRYVSPDLTNVLSDAVVEIYLGSNSRLRYVSLQDWGAGVTHLQVQRAEIGRDAELRSLAVAFGATLSRMEAESLLTGDGGSSEMLGVYVGHGDQHFDFRSIQDHVGSKTRSDLLYKGALKGSSRAIYSGNVILRPGAHLVDAYQTNRNILLSDKAKADSIPNLEILSNDPVRCGHAASVGPVEEETLFYLQSRGIPYEEAEKLVVFGFFQEVLDRVTIAEVKLGVEEAIAEEIAVPELVADLVGAAAGRDADV
jgi:Fe-S cluster assembly protein SufD